jgi:hypothetical protein
MSKATRDTVARDALVRRVRELGHTIEPDTVIARENVYRVDREGSLLVRTSRFHESREVYFFGLTRHNFENFTTLPREVIAFVLSDKQTAIIVPARWLWDQRSKISSDHKQYKLEIDKSLRLTVLRGAGQSVDLSPFYEQFNVFEDAFALESAAAPKELSDNHSALQGMLLEIGNVRGFETYCPNRSPRFRSKALGDISTLRAFPEFPGLNNDIIRQIDVVWLHRSFPIHAFEVELSTGIWPGLVRLGELRRLNTVFHVVTGDDEKAFKRRIAGDIFADIAGRCHHASAVEVRKLYESELEVGRLRQRLSL